MHVQLGQGRRGYRRVAAWGTGALVVRGWWLSVRFRRDGSLSSLLVPPSLFGWEAELSFLCVFVCLPSFRPTTTRWWSCMPSGVWTLSSGTACTKLQVATPSKCSSRRMLWTKWCVASSTQRWRSELSVVASRGAFSSSQLPRADDVRVFVRARARVCV